MKTSNEEDLQKVNKLMRNYSTNRPHTAIVSLIIFGFLFFSMFGLSTFIGKSNSLIIIIPAVLFLTCISIGLIFFSIPKYNRQLLSYITLTIFKKEGIVNNQILISPAKKKIMAISAGIFIICVPLNVLLGFFNLYDPRYMQPISAIYVVPFMLVIIFFTHPIAKINLIWPILYAVHAVLTIFKIPVFFDSQYLLLNMSSIFIYGLFTLLISFFVGQINLQKLKSKLAE